MFPPASAMVHIAVESGSAYRLETQAAHFSKVSCR